ncbi:MAG: hypothetical protein KFW07_01765 [Mycoplasmataceae bacterium]|nr:hypothetical protein [Mycoplasmataceae bacterium]
MKKSNLKEKNLEEREENYTSLIDEFRRQKIIYKSMSFKASSIDIVWDALEKTISKTFKIKRELIKDIEFGIKVRGVFTKYLLEEHDKEKREISIFWLNSNDKYWLHYKIVPTISKKKFKIRFKEIIYRDQTFFGLADTAGLLLLKYSFRKNTKMFANGIKSIIKNGSEEVENNSLT